MGHFAVSLLYPMNPLLTSVLGYLTSIYALMAHDARSLDLNDHVKHHHFTESDKRKVLENFLGNEEVLFFVYGLLFP